MTEKKTTRKMRLNAKQTYIHRNTPHEHQHSRIDRTILNLRNSNRFNSHTDRKPARYVRFDQKNVN